MPLSGNIAVRGLKEGTNELGRTRTACRYVCHRDDAEQMDDEGLCSLFSHRPAFCVLLANRGPRKHLCDCDAEVLLV